MRWLSQCSRRGGRTAFAGRLDTPRICAALNTSREVHGGIMSKAGKGDAVAVGRRWLMLSVGAIAVMAPLAHARQVAQTLAVSARVSPSAIIALDVAAQPLVITSADMDRGYVDVVMKSRMRVMGGTEARPAVVMAMEPRPDLFKSAAMDSTADGHASNGNGNGNGHSGNGNGDGHTGNGNGHSG